MNALVVIQARIGSSRLPGKVLEPLAGRPLLAFMLERIAELDVGQLVVATSDQPRDDLVAALGHELGIPVVRASEPDVLSRFVAAIDTYPAERIVRLTADSPLCDPVVVGDALALHARRGVAYTSNSLLRTFPDGLDVEIVEAAALREADEHATHADEREHVTPYVQRHPDRFPIAQLDSGCDLGHLRWTVDEPADLERLRAMVAAVERPERAPWRDFLGASPASLEPALTPARAGDDLPGAPPWVERAARDWYGGGDRPFVRVYTDRRGAWIALEVVEGVARVTLGPEHERGRLLAEARAVVAADRQLTELLETPA
jgi:spore coat polysaccharide biosynthesis protein SpsF